ncbi:uncharacterized protein [Ptychodera flava]|uniref:uncharacterized protein n=1 Tax=Ptychodera flava TaxID=63121 RepID=UPI00396A8652
MPAYNPKCVTMQFNNPSRVWKTNECKRIKSQSTNEYTSCKCAQPTIAAVVMTMGHKPEPFLVAARDVIITIANGISFLLVSLSTVFIILSGLDTEQYFVIRHYTISFLSMPLFVFLGGLTTATMVNNISTAVVQFSFLSTTAWTMNLAIESYRRLACYIHTSKYGR